MFLKVAEKLRLTLLFKELSWRLSIWKNNFFHPFMLFMNRIYSNNRNEYKNDEGASNGTTLQTPSFLHAFFSQIIVFFNKNHEKTNLSQKKNIPICSIRLYHKSKTNLFLLRVSIKIIQST